MLSTLGFLSKQQQRGVRGMEGLGWKALHPPKVNLCLRFHAWLGSFITYPSCKLSHLEHTIYP